MNKNCFTPFRRTLHQGLVCLDELLTSPLTPPDYENLVVDCIITLESLLDRTQYVPSKA